MEGRILVIDDEPAVTRTVRRHLERAGFEVQEAASGRAAQAAMESQSFDVAVVDLVMPGMDGLAVLSWMREHAPGVVPIVLSGAGNIEMAIQAVQRGAMDYVGKPLEAGAVFVQHVERAVALKRLQDDKARLVEELRRKTVEVENRLGQLSLAHQLLQSEALAVRADLNRAMRIQYALLPKTLPFPDRISLAVAYRPAFKVGGDFYDVYPLDDRHVAVYIADAAGHGVSSAMVALFVKLAIKPAEPGAEDHPAAEPGAALRALNQLIFQETFGHDMFVSITFLVLDTKTFEARYASAGHPALLLRRRDGAVESLRVPAPALGLNPNVRYAGSTVTLHKGDVLLLYTDGVLDVQNRQGDLYGAHRLKESLAKAEPNPHAVIEAIQGDMAAFQASDMAVDDITVLALGASAQPVPYKAPEIPSEAAGVPAAEPAAGIEVCAAQEGGRVFIGVTGAGSWREGQRVLDLMEQARREGGRSVILDLSRCSHLDSTFLGVLHTLASQDTEDAAWRFEIQGVRPPLLREMSDLGLTSVLMRFRSRPLPLPESMRAVSQTKVDPASTRRLLMRAHEALIQADPTNADRFAAVLEVLHAQVKPAPSDAAPRGGVSEGAADAASE